MIREDELQKLRDLPLTPGGGLLKRLGITFSHGRFLCPAHPDHSPSATISKSGKHWKCWSCGAGGNAIDLTMFVLHKSFTEACQFLADENNVIIQQSNFQSIPSKGDKRGSFDASRYVRFFEHPWLSPEARHFLFDERKLDPAVISWCRLTSWRDRNGTNWLQIPYYDANNKLIGLQNRNLSGPSQPLQRGGDLDSISMPPRFRFVQGSTISIYNLPILRYLKKGDECWIAEGCSDAWALCSDHRKAIAIASATLLQPKDKELLQEVTQRLEIRWRMSPDADEPGRKLASQLQDILPMLEIVPLPQGVKDYSDARLLRLAQGGE